MIVAKSAIGSVSDSPAYKNYKSHTYYRVMVRLSRKSTKFNLSLALVNAAPAHSCRVVCDVKFHQVHKCSSIKHLTFFTSRQSFMVLEVLRVTTQIVTAV